MSEMKKVAIEFIKDESGQSMIEYALIAALIGVVAVSTMTTLGTAISTKFSTIASQLTAA